MSGESSFNSFSDTNDFGSETSEQVEIDWSKCIICQADSDDRLVCPALTKRSDLPIGIGYETLEKDLKGFQELHELPACVKLSSLDDGDGLFSTFIRHCAKFHKHCRTKYDSHKLEIRKKSLSVSTKCNNPLDSNANKRTRSALDTTHVLKESRCFFCENIDKEDELCDASTFKLDSRLRECAVMLNDTKLLSKLSTGDVIAIEAKYHKRCLVSLYARVRAEKRRQAKEDREQRAQTTIESLVFAELVSYVNEDRFDIKQVFKLSDLRKLYAARLEFLGVYNAIHSGRFKDRLCKLIPDLRAFQQGRETVLAFKEDIGQALLDMCKNENDDNAICLARAANIIREELFPVDSEYLSESAAVSGEKSTSSSLLMLVRMVLEGSSIRSQLKSVCNKSSQSIAELIKFNSVKHMRTAEVDSVRHRYSQETPLPVYIGLSLYAQTRKKSMIDKLHQLGLSISYDRVSSIVSGLGSAVCDYYNINDTVCPLELKPGLFTTAAIDNIDHNPSTNSLNCASFHGTGISLIQHPDEQLVRCGVQVILPNRVSVTDSTQLPLWYSSVQPDTMRVKDQPTSCKPVSSRTCDEYVQMRGIPTEYYWLYRVENKLIHDTNDESSNTAVSNKKVRIGWSAYHSERSDNPRPTCVSAMLPLFSESAATVSMMKHGMDVVKRTINKLNPAQTPVIACDQPLYAIAKQIQWTWPERYGLNQIFIMFGGLHIEMAALKTVGQWLRGSGWSDALVNAGITTSGVADSLLDGAHVKRARYAHQVTAAALFVLQRRAFQDSQDELTTGEFDTWCAKQGEMRPQFKFWSLALEIEMTILMLIRSIRTADFELYIYALQQLLPWFFALDRTHYSRWLSVHVHDLLHLPTLIPALAENFKSGKFTVQKTENKFSAMAIDQAHEQNNKLLKGEGGIIGLTDQSSMQKWMIAGPEVVRVVQSFEDDHGLTKCHRGIHHEVTDSFQKKFAKDVQALITSVDELGSPFDDDGEDLISLSSKVVADKSSCNKVKEIKDLGIKQYKAFVDERLNCHDKPVMEVIARNRFQPFKPIALKVTSNSSQVKAIKSDVTLFSRLYIGCQTRNGNLDEFFKYENQPFPPALADSLGRMRHGKKSDIVDCLLQDVVLPTEPPRTSAVVLDGAAIVQMIKPKAGFTFMEYSSSCFVPYVCSFLQKCNRVDVVWDEYDSSSLKAMTRQMRGNGNRQRVAPNVKTPRNWQKFLRVDDNKKELFAFLAKQVVDSGKSSDRDIVATLGQNVLCSRNRDLSALMQCTHEEADTRMMVHCRDSLMHGHRTVTIRTVDSDVLAIAVSIFEELGADELWIAFGTGKNYRFIPVHEIVSKLGTEKSKSLAFFHAFTGCDTVSSFAGRGKKMAYDTWNVYPNITATFKSLCSNLVEVSDQHLDDLQRFVCLLYDRTSTITDVDVCRKYLFTKRGRSYDCIPPTMAALVQHIRRAAYQGGHIWSQSLELKPLLPNPSEWGWLFDVKYTPNWTTLPQVAQCCSELIHCKCKVACRGMCACNRAGLRCTTLCDCDGDCHSQ